MHRPGQFLGQHPVHRPLPLDPVLPGERRRDHAKAEMTLAALAPASMSAMLLRVVDQLEIDRRKR